MFRELDSRSSALWVVLDVSTPRSLRSAMTSLAHRMRRTSIWGDDSVSKILESLNQKLSGSLLNGTNPGPSNCCSGSSATSFRVVDASKIHHGARTQIS